MLSLLTLSLSLLHKTRLAIQFSGKKKSRVAFGLAYLLIELFYIGMPVVRTNERSVGRTVTWLQVPTKGSRMHRWPNFPTHGAQLRTREYSAIITFRCHLVRNKIFYLRMWWFTVYCSQPSLIGPSWFVVRLVRTVENSFLVIQHIMESLSLKCPVVK